MAQYDTGLGWSANEEWLVSAADAVIGSLSVMGGSSFPGQPVGRAATINDMASVALPYQNVNNSWWTYIANDIDSPGNIVVFYYLDGIFKTWVIVSDASPITYHTASKDVGSDQWWGWNTVTTDGIFDASTGLYYGSTSTGGASYNIPPIPEFSNLRAGLDAIQVVHSDFTKTNAGFAVACVAKWKTGSDVIIHSPILISSVSSYTDMTDSSDTYNLAKLNVLLQGTRFYMAFYDITDADPTTSLPTLDLTDRGALTLEQVFMIIISTDNAHVIIITSPDPYETQTGGSEEDGGNGEEIVDDEVDFTPLPSSMAVASGFITLFCPSQYELNQLANYMWSPLFDVDTFKKLFANPMDCILGLAVYPFPISASGTKTVSVGGIATTVSMGYTLQQYHIVDCGSVYVPKQWGAYMDYAPYTRFNIFLPYIGFRSISADDIMGKTISLRYMVDILSGACNAELKCGGTVLYSWAGSCAAQIPITGNDWRSAITAGISIAGSVAATVLTQGASAPMIAGTVASATVNSMQLKPEVQRSGSISGSSGFLAGQRPYIVRTNPRSAIPANQNKYTGYPSFVTILLGSLTGYNEVYSVHLENIPATGAELDEIESILKGGAIF